LLQYLDYCSEEIPLAYPIRLSVEIPEEKRNPTAEKMVEQGIRNNIRLNYRQLQKAIKRSNAVGIFEMISAFFFLFAAYYLIGVAPSNVLLRAVVEGISIWGWVLEWQGILTFFFSKPGFRKQKKHYSRYLEAEIVFKNKKETYTTSNPALMKKRTVAPRSPVAPTKKKRKLPISKTIPHATPLQRKKR
jgi:hypothetical protein